MSYITQDTYFTHFCVKKRKVSFRGKKKSYFQLTNELYSKIDNDKSITGNMEHIFPEKQYGEE